MSIWSDNMDELEENMMDIVRQRLLSGEYVMYFVDNVVDIIVEQDLEDATDICSFLEQRLGRKDCHNVMDEAFQMFIDKQADSAELSYGLMKDAEADVKESEDGKKEEE